MRVSLKPLTMAALLGGTAFVISCGGLPAVTRKGAVL